MTDPACKHEHMTLVDIASGGHFGTWACTACAYTTDGRVDRQDRMEYELRQLVDIVESAGDILSDLYHGADTIDNLQRRADSWLQYHKEVGSYG